MGTRELEWIDIGDGAGGRSVQGQRGRKPSPAERRERRREETRQTAEAGNGGNRGSAGSRGMDGKKKVRKEIEVIGLYASSDMSNVRSGRLQAEEWEDEWEEEEWEEEWEEPVPAPVTAPSRKKKRENGEKKAGEQQTRQNQRVRKRRRAKTARRMLMFTSFLAVLSILLGIALAANYIYQELKERGKSGEVPAAAVQVVEEVPVPQDIRKWAPFYAAELERPELAVDLLTVNEYSRPGEALPEVKNIFVHYTANAGTTAEQNKSYFQSLAETHERSASAHFIIGYDGIIVQCIPTAEIAYAVKERNYDSISIECCFLDESGEFTQETYDKLIELTAWLLHKFELEPGDVLRHYDEGGKICPKYYVEHEDAWQKFLQDLENYMTRVAADAARSGS